MKTRATTSSPINFGRLHATALICLGTVVVPAHADAPMASAIAPSEVARSIPLDVLPEDIPSHVVSRAGTALNSAGDGDNIDLPQGNINVPQGNEMSVIAGVELERTDRRFRSRVVDWAKNKSLAAGLATDFLLHGSDSGVHLDVQSRSSYVVRWRKRF